MSAQSGPVLVMQWPGGYIIHPPVSFVYKSSLLLQHYYYSLYKHAKTISVMPMFLIILICFPSFISFVLFAPLFLGS